MTLNARNLKESIGSEVHVAVEDLLQPAVAAEVRELLLQRGVLVFPQLGISDEGQVRLAGLPVPDFLDADLQAADGGGFREQAGRA